MRQQPIFVEVLAESLGQDIIEIRSTSNPNKIYKVDTVKQRCSCPAWIFQRGERKPCKHLRAMRITRQVAPKIDNMEYAL